MEKRTQNQGYYRNLDFFRIFLHEVRHLKNAHIYQDIIPDTLFWKNHQKNALIRKISHNLGAFFLEKRTRNQGYYRNLEFFRLLLHEVHNLEKSHIYQDFISETRFWKNHQKNALFRKTTLIFGAFFF